MNKMIHILCAFALLFGTFPSAAQQTDVRILDEDNVPYSFLTDSPYIDENNRTMIPLSALNQMVPAGLSVAVDQGGITIQKERFESRTTLELELGNPLLRKDGTALQMDVVPVKNGAAVYVPLKFVGEALDYHVWWESENGIDFVHFVPMYAAAELTIWNQAETTQAPLVRYALTPGSAQRKTLSDVQAVGTDQLESILSRLAALPDGEQVQITVLYGASSHKVPEEAPLCAKEEITRRLGLKCTLATACTDELPAVIHTFTDFENRWYSEQLSALGMDPVFDLPGAVYRFTYIGSFDEPVSVQVHINTDGSGMLRYAGGDAPAGPFRGTLIQQGSISLSSSERDELQHLIELTDFWNLPPDMDQFGMDGSIWLMEGVQDGAYLAVHRWVPCQSDPVYVLGRWFLLTAQKKGLELPSPFLHLS